jgi:hypothetical protein
MKMKLTGAAVVLVALLASALVFGRQSAASSHRTCDNAATPAPTATGQVMMDTPLPLATTPPLAWSLSATQALEQVLVIDQRASTWDKPWSINTLWTEPGRITMVSYQSLQEYRDQTGNCSSLSSEVEADIGSIWEVTIRGRVQINTMTMDGNGAPKCENVTYLISQRTGRVFSFQGCSS